MQLKENATGVASAQESQRGVVARLVYVFEQVMPDPFATAPNLRGNWLTCGRIIMASGSTSPAREGLVLGR